MPPPRLPHPGVQPWHSESLRPGDHAILKGRCVRLDEVQLIMPGKHGHRKTRMVGRDVLNGSTVNDVVSTFSQDVLAATVEYSNVVCVSSTATMRHT